MSLTSQIRYFRALDNAVTTGAGKTGLAFGDFTAKYLTQGGTLTSLTTETITTLGMYQAPTDSAHIRIKELANADPSKGIYEVHFHNTQVAASGNRLWLFLSASGAAIDAMEIDLSAAAVYAGAGNTAQTGDSYALANGASGFVATKADTAAIKAKTDNLPGAPAAVSDIPTAAANAALTAAAVSSDHGAGSYVRNTEPDNTSITAIKARTDLIPNVPAAVGSAMTLAAGSIATATIVDGAITDAKFTVPTYSGVATGVLSRVDQLWRRFFKKAVHDSNAGTITLYADDNLAVQTTQSATSSGGVETQGPAA